MFVLGLLAGPTFGLLLAYLVYGWDALSRRAATGVMGLLMVAIAILPIFKFEFKLGLVCGLALGWLLFVTPQTDV